MSSPDHQTPPPCPALVVLPPELRGYVRYMVVMDPRDHQPYSVGIRFVCPSRGATRVLQFLVANRGRRHKKSIQAWLCPSAIHGVECPAQTECDGIHVTPEGFATRRPWTQPVHLSRTIHAPAAPPSLPKSIDSPCDTPPPHGFRGSADKYADDYLLAAACDPLSGVPPYSPLLGPYSPVSYFPILASPAVGAGPPAYTLPPFTGPRFHLPHNVPDPIPPPPPPTELCERADSRDTHADAAPGPLGSRGGSHNPYSLTP
eukprot:EG_transcript_24851